MKSGLTDGQRDPNVTSPQHGFPVFISDDPYDDNKVLIEILALPKESFSMSVKEAGDHLYWVAEYLTKFPGVPYVLTHNQHSITMDPSTALNLYNELKEWSAQYYDDIADLINTELDMFRYPN